MTYSEKLKSPKWQKKRLLILERDEWTCQNCGSNEHTLHVHHRVYHSKKEPWEYEDKLLVTLCELCHSHETELGNLNMIPKSLGYIFNEAGFLNSDLLNLIENGINVKFNWAPEVMASVISYFLNNHELQELATSMFWDDLNKRSEPVFDKIEDGI